MRPVKALLLGLLSTGLLLPSGAELQEDVPKFTIARVVYDGGGDWYSDPSSLPNLLEALRERTSLPMSDREAKICLTSKDLYNYPYLYITGHGNIRFTDEEVSRLREFLIGGGFLHADDNFGMDESFRREIRRVFPGKELVEIPFDHSIYHIYYRFPEGLPKIHKHHGGPPRGYGIFHGERMLVFYSYNTDLGDGWEDPDVHDDPPEKREEALRMGVNIFLYAVTH
jgi:hypothetical protein